MPRAQFVASPSAEMARVSAAVLSAGAPFPNGDSVEQAERGAQVTLVIGDPIFAGLMEGGTVPGATEWLTTQCRFLEIPVPTDGDFPFSTGAEEIDSSRVRLVRFESLHLLGMGGRAAHSLANVADIRGASFSPGEIDAAYRDPCIERLYKPFHRTMLRAKWSQAPSPTRNMVVFHHIPKCAGMSVFHHLNKHYTWNDELVHLDSRAEHDVNAAGAVPFAYKDPRELDRIEVLFGHRVSVEDLQRVRNRRPLLATCLRDPASRLVSHYNWEMHQQSEGGDSIEPFESWYERQETNWITRWLARSFLAWNIKRVDVELVSERVREALEGFWLVGTTSHFDAMARTLTDRLGLPPIEKASNQAGESYPARFSLTDEWRERIVAEHPFDQALFQRWDRPSTKPLASDA